MLKPIWQYRQFIVSSIKNDLTYRFVRSRLGGIWMIIHTLVQVAIYALILSGILSAKLPGMDNKYAYAIYLTSGILAWSLFSDVISRCLTLFIDNGNLMSKVAFPRATLPIIAVGTCLVNNILLFLAIIVIFLLLGHIPNIAIIYLPLITIVLLMLAISVGLILSILNVFLRDTGQIFPILLQLGFWVTPIVYPVTIVPDSLKPILALNPMYTIVSGYQSILVFGKAPDMAALGITALVSTLLMMLSFYIYHRAAAEMVDAL